MNSTVSHSIHELFIQSSAFAKNDVLVNIQPSKDILPFEYQKHVSFEFFKSLIKTSSAQLKENGTNPMCIAAGSISWEVDGTLVTTPLLIQPVTFIHDKVRSNVHLEWNEEDCFVNPYLIHRLSVHFDIHSNFGTNLNELIDQLKSLGFNQLTPGTCYIGIIHHHRYAVLKELEALQVTTNYSGPLHQLLGEDTTSYSHTIRQELLLPADADHRKCFEAVSNSNCCIQGPPGTGKSQILTNFIGKSLVGGQSLLIISEKKSALDILEKKLSSFHLDILTMVASDQLKGKDFVRSLQESWNFFETYERKRIPYSIRKEREDNLQLTLDILRQPHLIGGVDYATFFAACKLLDLSDYHFSIEIPSVSEFLRCESTLLFVFEHKLQHSLGIIIPSIVTTSSVKELSKHLPRLIKEAYLMEEKYGLATIKDVDSIKRQLVTIQLFENELVKSHLNIYRPGHKEQEKFLSAYRNWKKANHVISTYISDQTTWKRIPTEGELNDLIIGLQSGFFTRIKANRHWNELSTIPFKASANSIKELELYFDAKRRLEKSLTAFTRLSVDEATIEAIAQSIPLFSAEKWTIYNATPDQLKTNTVITHEIETFIQTLNSYFNCKEDVSIHSQLKDVQTKLHYLIEQQNEISSLETTILKGITYYDSFASYKSHVFGSHLSLFKQAYPLFSDFKISDLSTKIELCIQGMAEEGQNVSDMILDRVLEKFNSYSLLLSTPARQLSDDEKQLKQVLKRGKSLLTKEFSKSRQHKSIRELYESDARPWIQLLKPIWMSNPYLVASLFPMESDLFDLCIFDEASQIPLNAGLGSLQRSKRAVVAGDEQQMGPQSFFKAGGIDQESLLQRAIYYYTNHSLKHHYRSVHSDLIAFSNYHFYNDELLVFPSASQKEQAVTFHHVANGCYIDRVNEEEAKYVASLIREKVATQKSLGIVAFSQPQLHCIWEALDSETQQLLEERIEDNTAFFKPLEKVQGDECQQLIISFGYGRNEEGNFELRFGPMNTEAGRKRLNVLVTRASESIDFIASVTVADFKISDNESIDLIRKWFAFVEQGPSSSALKFPMGITPIVKDNQLHIQQPYATIGDAVELITLHSVLKNRGWEIVYT